MNTSLSWYRKCTLMAGETKQKMQLLLLILALNSRVMIILGEQQECLQAECFNPWRYAYNTVREAGRLGPTPHPGPANSAFLQPPLAEGRSEIRKALLRKMKPDRSPTHPERCRTNLHSYNWSRR